MVIFKKNIERDIKKETQEYTQKVLSTLEWILFNKKDLDKNPELLIVDEYLDSNKLDSNSSYIKKFKNSSKNFGEYSLSKTEKTLVYGNNSKMMKDVGYKYILKRYGDIIFLYSSDEISGREEVSLYGNETLIKNFMRLFGN